MQYHDGMRVRLKRSVKWCAGTPRVGSTGTIRASKSPPGAFYIEFDRVKPKGNFVFGLISLETDEFLEVIHGKEKAT